jgi:hypothetical protein
MTDYCVDLTLPINPLIDGISIDSLQENNAQWTPISLEYINSDLKKLFQSLDLKIKIAGLFVLNGYSSLGVHIDGFEIYDATKINWSYNTNYDMVWYNVRAKNKKNIVGTANPNNSSLLPRYYVSYNKNEVEEIYRYEIKFPSIVQVGIPHTLENYTGVKKCLSITLFDMDNKTVPMHRAKELFSQYLAP